MVLCDFCGILLTSNSSHDATEKPELTSNSENLTNGNELIGTLGFSARAKKALGIRGLVYVKDLCGYDLRKITQIPGIGKKTAREIKRISDENGIYTENCR